MTITRVQSASSEADPASATFGSTPTQGNLLVAQAVGRNDNVPGANYTISGTGWTKRITRDVLITDFFSQRTMSVWTKVAGASEPTTIQVDNGSAQPKGLLIQEFNDSAGGTWNFLEAASNDDGGGDGNLSISTGTTASVGAGTHLIIGLGMVKVQGGAPANEAWTNGLAGHIDNAAGSYAASAFEEDTASGTKESTFSFTNATNNRGLIAGILVFEAAGAGVTATGASALPSIASSGQGELTLPATGASVLPSIQQAAQALLVPEANGASQLPAIVQAGTVEEKLAAAGAQSLPAIVQSGVAELILEMVGALQLPAIAQNGVGFLLPEAAGAVLMPSVQSAGSATASGQPPTGTGASILPSILSAGAADLVLPAAGNSVLPGVQMQAQAELVLLASGASILPGIQMQASIEEILAALGASVLPGIRMDAVVVLELPGAGAQVLPAIRMDGIGLLVPETAGAQVLPSIQTRGIAALVGAVVKKEGQVSLLQRLSQNRLSWRF